jgi:hypothetical protein
VRERDLDLNSCPVEGVRGREPVTSSCSDEEAPGRELAQHSCFDEEYLVMEPELSSCSGEEGQERVHDWNNYDASVEPGTGLVMNSCGSWVVPVTAPARCIHEPESAWMLE